MKKNKKRIDSAIKSQQGLKLPVSILLIDGVDKKGEEENGMDVVKAGTSHFYNDTLRIYRAATKSISKYDF